MTSALRLLYQKRMLSRKRPFWRRTLYSCAAVAMISVPAANAFTGKVFISTKSTAAFSTAVNTVDLHYSDFVLPEPDAADAPPVLLLHGLLGNRRNFATIGRSLAQQLEKPRRVTAVDLRNHGDTAAAQAVPEMTYTDMAADVLQFLDRHEIDRAVLVGHSMGGKVAQTVALTAPERVDGLVVLDIAPVPYTEEDAPWKAVVDILFLLDKIPVGSSKKEVDQFLLPTIPDSALRAFILTNWDAKESNWKIPISSIVKQIEALASFDIDPSVHQYHGDVFLIHGGQSRFVRHAYMERIGEYFPNHLLTTIKGAGHWVHAEAPQDTTALLKRFLDR
ncbi:abhydrolase domain-containing protein 11 [Fistulifera solaris]|uniref:Abhydrolase domain-containing protein 11 n=1 Tax=Fistulifera solaris TaxID=1519565 RepID=A0A1Z5K7A3_FISSO|nr:abhydrolase domain-containing protein 11 [Fistulifera solaris]|eukprot:GAX21808.1 abhydrolase domain-containing protein 11 [Fistulifera solaris]